MSGPLVIAVDGPAASGKGTIAEGLARHFGLSYLDTGLLYRAVAVLTKRKTGDLDKADAEWVARSLRSDALTDPALRTREAGEWASRVAAHGGVRAALLDFQRAFAAQEGGAVLDGRDIGTVIAPNAVAKLYVTARPEVRAASSPSGSTPASPAVPSWSGPSSTGCSAGAAGSSRTMAGI